MATKITIACCLNCVLPSTTYIYCRHLKNIMNEGLKFDETGETQACVCYVPSIEAHYGYVSSL